MYAISPEYRTYSFPNVAVHDRIVSHVSPHNAVTPLSPGSQTSSFGTSPLMYLYLKNNNAIANTTCTPTSRLNDMLRTRSQWAQADAMCCLGWLVGIMADTALHELVPLVTQLMVKHMETDDSIFIEEERRRKERPRWGSNSSGSGRGQDSWRSTGGRSGGGGGGGGQQQFRRNKGVLQQDNAGVEEAVRERIDNIRVYSLIFLLKVSCRIEWTHCVSLCGTGGLGRLLFLPLCCVYTCGAHGPVLHTWYKPIG